MTANMPMTGLDLDAKLAIVGPAAESFARLWQVLWKQARIPPPLLELCRLTLARLHGFGAEMAAVNVLLDAPVAPERRAAVLAGTALEDPAFTQAEQAVLLFAEYYWVDPQSITDEAAEAAKAHFGEGGLVLLIEALGCIDGRMRTARCLADIAMQREIANVG